MARYEPDEMGTERPTGFSLVVQLTAADIEEAEDIAIATSTRFQRVAAFFLGFPAQEIQIQRLAEVNTAGHLLLQREYYYDGEEAPGVPLDS